MNEITYTMVGDYNLPNLTLPQQSEVTLGKWSRMRKTYLKEHHKILYYNLLTKGTLTQHLSEVQQRATDLEESLVKQMTTKAGLTEQMKANDMMKWVRLMNNIRNSAQEIVKERITPESLSVMVVVRLSLSRHPRQVVRSPCGSASTRSTFLPSRASPTPKLTVVVVLPVPPF